MYDYIKGKIVEIGSNNIVIENNGIGYLVYVPNPFSFQESSETIVYIFQHVREDEMTLYGFKTKVEKELFLKLINVKGLGCKMALPIIATGSIDGIADAIERENVLYLKKFPKIGDKVARQIILDLKGKIFTDNKGASDVANMDELIEVLKGLGYKQTDINKILPNINKNNSIEEQVKEALKLLLTR